MLMSLIYSTNVMEIHIGFSFQRPHAVQPTVSYTHVHIFCSPSSYVSQDLQQRMGILDAGFEITHRHLIFKEGSLLLKI